jgi:ATP-dependent DNA ligase
VAVVLDVDEAVIDGEVIAAEETGRPQFRTMPVSRA